MQLITSCGDQAWTARGSRDINLLQPLWYPREMFYLQINNAKVTKFKHHVAIEKLILLGLIWTGLCHHMTFKKKLL